MSKEKKNLKERLAAISTSKNKEARTRVASAWTLAKSLVPTAPTEIQYKLASSLLNNETQVLTAALRQTAINAHYTKVAEKFEQIHKVELNELLEDESFLKKMLNEVKSELKGEAKNASAECKCSGKGCEDCEPKTASSECKCGGEGCEDCLKTAADEGEDNMLPEGEESQDMPLEDEENPVDLPADQEEDVPSEDETPEGEDFGVEIPDEKKEELKEKIQNLEADVQALEEAIEGEEELDFSKIFDEEGMEDKTDSLANEEEMVEAADNGAGFGDELTVVEGDLEEGDGFDGDGEPHEFFTTASAFDGRGMDSLLGKTADASTKGFDIVERGAMAEDMLDESGVPDAEEDHDDVILFEVLTTLKPESYDPGDKRHAEPKLEKAASPKGILPKTATRGKDGKPIRSLGNVKTATVNKDQAMLSSLVFPDESEW